MVAADCQTIIFFCVFLNTVLSTFYHYNAVSVEAEIEPRIIIIIYYETRTVHLNRGLSAVIASSLFNIWLRA